MTPPEAVEGARQPDPNEGNGHRDSAGPHGASGRQEVWAPRVPAGAHLRPRLLSRLDEAWDLAVVHGPAGSGKTVLLAQWVHSRREPATWADAGGLDAIAAEPSAATPSAGRPGHGILVVDAADELGDAVVARLMRALERNPSLRIVVATRSADVAARLARATDVTVLVIDADELRVTEEELVVAAPTLPEQRRTRLLAETHGLQVAVRDALEGTTGRTVDRFRARLLARMPARPAGYADALARLGVVREVNGRVATLIGVAPEWLALAEEDGLGWQDDGWLQVSPFAAAVLAPLADALPAKTQQTIRRAALTGGLMERRPLEALRLAIALGDLDAATDIVIEHGVHFLSESRGIREAFAVIPVSGLQQHPMLMLLAAQALNLERSTRLRGLQMFGQVIVSMLVRSDRVDRRDAVMLRSIAATLMRFTPLADQALPQVRKAVAAIDTLEPEQRESIVVGGAYLTTHLALTAMYSGDEELADEMFERAYSSMRERQRAEMVDALSLWAAHRAFHGDLPHGRELATLSDESEWPDGWRTGLQVQGLRLAQAILALEEGDIGETDARLHSCGPIEDLLEHWSTFAIVRAWRDAVVGEPGAGRLRLQAVRRHRSRTPTTSVAKSWLDAAESLLTLMAGDLGAAHRLAAAAAKRSPTGVVALVRVHVATGADAEALVVLRRLAAVERMPLRDRVEADLLTALVADRSGAPHDADSAMVRVIEDLTRTGLRMPLVALSDADRERAARIVDRLGRADLVAFVQQTRPPRPVQRIVVPRLTKREQALLATLHEHASVAGLAGHLHVSPNTVKAQLRSLYRKLDVHARDEALSRAAALGLTDHRGEAQPD